MATTIPTFALDAHTVSLDTDDATAELIALDWLHAKDIENAAKAAEKIRKAAGELLLNLIGKGGKVTVNKGGFRSYILKTSPCKGRISADRALEALVDAGKLTREDADAALEASRGTAYTTIKLEAEKV